jgi:hypothetical protein
LAKNPLAVEKLDLSKLVEKTLRYESLQTTFWVFLDILYPQISAVLTKMEFFNSHRLITLKRPFDQEIAWGAARLSSSLLSPWPTWRVARLQFSCNLLRPAFLPTHRLGTMLCPASKPYIGPDVFLVRVSVGADFHVAEAMSGFIHSTTGVETEVRDCSGSARQ